MKNLPVLVLAFLCLGGMWLYVDRVLVAYQVSAAAANGTPRGNLSDLYPIWLGSRELLLRGRNPYGAEITAEIQAGYYGRPLDASRPADPSNRQAFAYPVYVAFLLAPSIRLPFPDVRRIFFWLLIALTMSSIWLWFLMLDWTPSAAEIAVVTILTLGTFAVVQGAKLQQLSLLVAALIAMSLALLASGQLMLAGILLAFATIKPQLVLVLAAWLTLWSLADLRTRWKLPASFFVALAALILGGEHLLPGWIGHFYSAVMSYRQYAASGPLLDQMLTPAIGLPVRILINAGLVGTCWSARKYPRCDVGFQLVTCLVLAATLLLIPLYPPHYQLLLLPGILLLCKQRYDFWRSSVAGRVLLAVTAAPLLWSWTTAIALASLSFLTPAVQKFWQVPLWPTVALPVPVTACLGLLLYKSRTVGSAAGSPHPAPGKVC